MSVTIAWLNEDKNALYLKFTKPWDWTEFYAAYEQGRPMTDSVDHTVHIVLDFRDSGESLPPNFLTHFKYAATNAHPRRGAIIVVSKRMMLVKSFVNMIRKVVPMKNAIYFANSLEEVQTIIKKQGGIETIKD